MDVETGQVILRRFANAVDVGKAINPLAVRGQICGGSVMGIGSALTEEVLLENGNILNPNLTDYKLLTTNDIPKIEDFAIAIVESAPHKNGPYGAKGVGEATLVSIMPAIANAVYNAVSVRIKDMSITPEKILEALDGSRTPP